MELSIVIVNWNSRVFLDTCLSSLTSSGMNPLHEIIVVDNASYDGTQKLLCEKYPFVKYVQSPINGGFSFANNLGAKEAKGEALLFLNPDTEILDNAISEVFQTIAEDESIGAANCVLLNSDGTVQESCVEAYPTILNQTANSKFLRKLFPKSFLWGNAVLLSKENGIHDVETLSGAFLMIRKEVFEDIGGFDEMYFMYAEDRDLCYRVAKAGYRVVIDKRASVIHHGGGSTSTDSISTFSNIMMRNSTYEYFRKHHGYLYATAYRISMGVSAVIRLCLLFVSYPAVRLKGGRFPAGSFSKWVHILMWSLGFEKSRKPVSS